MFWDWVAWVYDVFANGINRRANRAMCAAVAAHIGPEDEVLECACGTGLLTGVIAARCRALTATDFSEKMLAQAERKYANCRNVRFAQADITRLGYPDGRFDAVVAANVIHLLDEPLRALRELDRVCRPGRRDFFRLSGHRRQLHAAACIENGGRCHKRLGGIAMKLAFFDAKPYDRPGFDAHAAGTGLEIRYFETKLGEDTVQLARGFDGVCVFVNDTVNAKVADELYRLGVRVIALRCAGFNNVDTRACRGRLRIFRVPAYSPYAVAEHAMALLLTVNRHTHKAYIRTRDFNFSLSGLTGFDLHGKTAGVVGTGKIGRVFAEICRGFGMRVLAYDKFPDPGSGLCYAALPELFHQADVISLHCPLTDETRHMIDAAAIAGMKPGVVIVNTSRGALVDTEALIEGLRSRKIGAACLDVYEEEAELFYEDRSEAIIEDDTLVRLIAMPNIIVSSHQAFLTKEALNNIAAVTVDNLLKFGRGEPSPDTEVCAPKEQDQRRS